MLYCLKFQVFSLSWWILQLHELKSAHCYLTLHVTLLTWEHFAFIKLTQESAIDFIAVQTLDYKEQGKCRAGLEDDAPFAIAITAALISTLVLPVNVERDESKKGSSALGADDVRYAAMGVISFIPLFNWLVCSLASWRIFTLQLTLALFLLLPFMLYLLPLDLSSLFVCISVWDFV